jgi:ATP adenylyltransferase
MTCEVCEILKNERLVVYRDGQIVVLHNPHPFNNGHLIITISSHRSIDEIGKSLFIELMGTAKKFTAILQRVYNPHGFNIGISLKPHVYIQLVPRWSGDVSFVTLFYNIKVVPETIEDSINRIKSAVREAWPLS